MLALQDNVSFTVKDVPAGDFIKAYAAFLKKNDKVEIPAVSTLFFTYFAICISGLNSTRTVLVKNFLLMTKIGFTPEWVSFPPLVQKV